jgi:hypothetical protein
MTAARFEYSVKALTHRTWTVFVPCFQFRGFVASSDPSQSTIYFSSCLVVAEPWPVISSVDAEHILTESLVSGCSEMVDIGFCQACVIRPVKELSSREGSRRWSTTYTIPHTIVNVH